MSRGGLDSERFHNALHRLVQEAVEPVKHMEVTWSAQEMSKRISKYIRNAAASEEVLAKDGFPDAAKLLIDYGMSAFSAACEDRAWFFEIDLVPAFNAAAWELYADKRRRVNYDQLTRFVRSEFERQVDHTLVSKSLWDVCHQVFRDSVIAGKVYNAMWKTWSNSVQEAKDDYRPHLTDRKRSESFLQLWLEASMSRAWTALQDTGALTEQNMIKVFKGATKPFGGGTDFTCIPKELVHQWPPSHSFDDFITGAVRKLVHSWETESYRPAKKRKTKAPAWDEAKPEAAEEEEEAAEMNPEEDEFAPAEEAEDLPDDGVEEPPDVAEAPLGHPRCTSVEDCIGKPEDRLVQHVLDDAEQESSGDVYCETCWASFLQEQGRQLEGRWLDDGTPYPVTG
mmetsp:Transcript_62454/g.115999  ORF Transcript_62454/g.115999 Transcript_62454/m.115999 type:complete len:396 (-) Transcript_62454:124-1311(-)